MPGRAVSLAEALAAAMAVAFEAIKAAMSAAEMEDPWFTDSAAAIAFEAACTRHDQHKPLGGDRYPGGNLRVSTPVHLLQSLTENLTCADC